MDRRRRPAEAASADAEAAAGRPAGRPAAARFFADSAVYLWDILLH